MIFQDPLSSLHPLYKIGWQIVEEIQAHEDVSEKAARARALDALRRSGSRAPPSGSRATRTSSREACGSA